MYNTFYSFFISIVIYEIWRLVDMQITQPCDITPYNKLSNYFIYCRDSGRILDKTYLEILALQYIISDVAMDFIQ